MISVTRIESTTPRILTKQLSLDERGKLRKKSVAAMADGRAKTVDVLDLEQFGQLLDGLSSAQAVMYGTMVERREARIVSELERSKHPGAISRTKSFFQFRRGPGVMLLDHDGHPDGPIDPDDLATMIARAAPVLGASPMLWRASASSCIQDADGRELQGLVGQRLYPAVLDAGLVPAAGKALVKRLWAAGHGWVVVSRSGQALMRTLVDAAVWQPERLDFAGPAVLSDGLRRVPPPARLIGPDDASFVDLRQLDADGEIEQQALRRQTAARHAAEPEIGRVRAEYIEKEAGKLADVRQISLEAAREVVARAATQRVLMGDFVL
ncbi:MAG: hypothetical protein ACOYLX_23550, partial [Burkholderiaceae bacterium]